MINRVVLVGRLTRDPELRTTGSGISVATFTLAVDRQFTNSQGERGADFISCVIWRKAAENFCNFTSKGSLVGIDGRIQTRSYDNKDGQRVYVTEVIVDNFSLLESRKDREARGQNGGYTPNTGNNNGAPSTNNFQNNGGSQNNNPQNNNNQQHKAQDPFAGSGDTIDISDDDLPF
ncbi:single-stranded DNA-binding protein [Lactobacillus kefiranofaciens]|uniref:Single-stranded DNA-binding protein n=1 Tax=Lactobacillus kefiranofaciens TaxID=267818 RepID=A0AAX3UCM4_9LACO|nr:single-stranded DNA-binding protein [Lactobacillus kefiranofaciens]AEG41158.1 Single-stranded DNA-binding protein [Lactobacillus kefiranofaciens subsp. kefiranofaciens]KRL30099.1 single-stranded DNA-binding protein [Lactobacillus kefiranofaciens subsp. kefirgranum DSM 10550 = JCM 8572]KRM21726.1 single-stranded DNA-binding protein [Lactobacillus kefiranofaciens subsp. kefiranofaciens DSM 5016 = JCM 6985]PAK98039.1 single-stranded DNA-binding protein [Lactobacillus kefiranofaciens]QFQ67010.1